MRLGDRVVGLACLLAGLFLLLWVIPAETEIVDYGWVRPATVPNAMAVIIALCGAWLCVFPGTRRDTPDDGDGDAAQGGHADGGVHVGGGITRREAWLRHARAALLLFTLIIGLAGIARWGFVAVAPPLAFALMWQVGERRLRWLLLGALATPAVIVLLSRLLERPLP